MSQLTESWPAMVLLVLFPGTVLAGAITAFARLTDTNTAIDTGKLHGRLGVVGILLLFLLMLTGDEFDQSINLALGLFVLTAIAGVALYFIIRRKGILPSTLILIHASLAVVSLTALLFALPF